MITPTQKWRKYRTERGICINEDCEKVIQKYLVPNFEGKIQLILCQIAPAHILHFADVGLQDEILRVSGKLPELLQGGQAEGRLLHSGQEVTVLGGKSGKRLGRCLQLACVTACG